MRKYAYEIVYEAMEHEGHSDEIFHQIIKEHALPARDKSFLKRLAYGTIERAVESDWRLSVVSDVAVRAMEPAVRTILRMALYEIYYMEQIPEAVSCNEAVELTRGKGAGRYASFVNGVLRNVIRRKDALVPKKNWMRYSMPKDLWEYLEGQYGKKTTKKIADHFLDPNGSTTIHIDTNKISVEEYRMRLREQQVAFEDGVYMEDALRLTGNYEVEQLPGFQDGLFFVQDESSMLPVRCSGIRPGDVVVDTCSAPGGKSMHALMALHGQGQLYARDVGTNKLLRMQENFRRMQYDNVVVSKWDGMKADASMEGKADVVLADVPCSGIGIIRRKPEIKYHALKRGAELIGVQRSIAENAAKMLKPGGVLIYSTCTIHKMENEENVLWLEENCGMQRESLDPYLPEILHNKMTEQGMLQMIPGLQNSDGFFVARLRKTV